MRDGIKMPCTFSHGPPGSLVFQVGWGRPRPSHPPCRQKAALPSRLLGASFAPGTDALLVGDVTEKALGREGWGAGDELEA